MITQRLISARIDNATLGALETQCFAFGLKKNRVINDALRHYLRLMQAVDANGPEGRAAMAVQEQQMHSIEQCLDKQNVYTNRLATLRGMLT